MPAADTRPARNEEARRSRWIPYSFFAFFGVVITANAIMATFALDTFNGLSVDGAYDKGLHYNQTLANYETQRELGWHLAIDFAPDETRAGDIVVTAANRIGTPLRGATVNARLIRPTQEGYDQTLVLSEDTAGTYTGAVQVPLPGQWVIRVDVAHEDDSYRLERRITVQ